MSATDSSTATAVDDPHDDISVLNQRIDDLIAGQQRRMSWYRNPSFITSVAAIFISTMTTVVSWYRTYQQDITSLQIQLAATLQQANSTQLQAIDMMTKYKDDQPSLLRVSSTLNAQNLILIKQAYALARALGSAASPINLTNIAYALMQSNEVTLSENLLHQAIARSENSVEYGAALRVLGQLHYYNGQTKEGEATFKLALDTFKKYPNEAKSPDYVNYQLAYTRYYWAQSLIVRDCNAAKEQLAVGLQHLAQMSTVSRQQAGPTEGELHRLNQLAGECKSPEQK